MAMKLTARQKLERAHVWGMRQKEFVGLSGIFMVGATKIEPDPEKCPTAFTDGYNVTYGEQFLNDLTEEEVRGVALHENYHKCYRHTLTWRHLYKQSPILANVACDYVINLQIMEAGNPGVKLPEGACYDTKYAGMDAGEVFRLLCKQYPQLAHPQAVLCGELPPGFDEHDWDGAGEWTPDQEREIREKIDAAIRQGAILAGKMGGDQLRDIGELTKVKTDYRVIMRQFFTDACAGDEDLTYRRPNRRFLQHDLIMPTYQSETLPHVVVAIDTSGSIGGEILTNFLSNTVQMLRQVNPERVDLVYWDCNVAGHERYEQGEVDKLAASTKPAGGGGTSPQCVAEWIKKEKLSPTVVVFLSDGYVDRWPTGIDCPTLWCIAENDSCVPPGAMVAHI